ncbi:hypothetical protein D3C80_1652910 [compost metagenome]
MATPVVPLHPITAAQRLHQLPLPIASGDRHAIDLGLYPQARLASHPAAHGLLVGELVDAGMRNGVGNRATCRRQGGKSCQQAETLLQVVQALSALVIQLICHQRDALAVVVVIPVGKRIAQVGNFGFGLLHGPVGA